MENFSHDYNVNGNKGENIGGKIFPMITFSLSGNGGNKSGKIFSFYYYRSFFPQIKPFIMLFKV